MSAISNLSADSLQALCTGALEHVALACNAIMRIYACDFHVAEKADCTPLTEADTAANAILDLGLKSLTPRLPVLSEESPERIFADRERWKRYWLVDPLDGTREFVSKNGEFTVNVALIEHGVPVIGIVAAPALGWTAYAVRGQGAWMTRVCPPRNALLETMAQSAPERLQTRPHSPELATRIGVSRSHHPAELTPMLQRLGLHALKAHGSALKFVYVANGQLDLYPRLSSSSCEWDIAAGQCIVCEAGGAVLGRNGQALRYNERKDLYVPAFVACGDLSVPWIERLGWANVPESLDRSDA